MSRKRAILQVLFTAILLKLITSVIAQKELKNTIIKKCPGYRSTRVNQTNQNIVTILYTRTSKIAYDHNLTHFNYSITYELATHQNSDKLLKCQLESTELIKLAWNLTDGEITGLQPRNYHNVFTVSTDRHPYSYFTEIGYFYDDFTGNYYDTDKYCVQSISDDEIALRVCAVNNDCTDSSIPDLYCLPKCCALDETLLYWKRKCTRLTETEGKTPWEPPIYQSLSNPNKLVEPLPNIIYHMANLPENCSVMVYENGTIEERGYQYRIASRAEHYKDPSMSHEKENVKLILPSEKGGKLKIISFYNDYRKWGVENFEHFCVEGFHVKTKDAPSYTGKPDQFVVFFCPNDNSDQVMTGNEQEKEWKSWAYVGISLVSLLFLLATIMVYVVIWDKHNLHGLTIASYTGSTFGSYFFLTIAQLIYLYPNPEVTGLHSRGFFCYAVATLAHYFYLSGNLWLTVMNFDLWITFKSMRAGRRDDKEWKKFWIYSGVAWLFPLCLVISFIFVDEYYRDPLSGVSVPDYANGACFVSPYFRGDYVYAPMAILLILNIILILMTMWIFIKARYQTSKSLNSGGSTNQNRYNAVLFIKLFIVMGGSSIVDFLTWHYSSKPYKPWIVVALEVLSYFTPVVLFFLFCLNDKVIGQLGEKYPRFTEKMRPFLKLFLKEETGGSQYTGDQSSQASNKTNLSSLDTLEIKKEKIPLRAINSD